MLRRDSNTMVQCAHCRTMLVLPPRATSIRCAVCNQVTRVAPFPTPSPPVPNLQQYVPTVPNAHGSKKALICGISYRNTRQELKGSLNDAKCMRYLLTTKFKFPETSILLLTEDQTDQLRLPTKANIRMAMRWLVQGCQSGDSLVFHYSGHGSQRRNYTGDEVDNLDETLLPMDYKKNGVIVDDEINLAIVRPLPRGVRLHAVVDACHSGTVLDLPYLCQLSSHGDYRWEDQSPRTGVWKGTSGGEAYCFSGCDDSQKSADTTALSQNVYTGAMTYSFIQAIEKGRSRTYKELLMAMRDTVRNVDAGGLIGPVTSLLQMLFAGGGFRWKLGQEPQLTASSPFNIDTPFYL